MKDERNLQTVENFVPAWKKTPNQLRIEGIISTYKETHRLTDNWPYYADDSGIFIRLIKENQKDPEKIYVRNLIKKDGFPEDAEAEILDQLESWVSKNTEGSAVWLSPPFPGKYPCSKIIFHQVAYEYGTLDKVILNSAVLFDADKKDILELVHKHFPQTWKIYNVEELRSVLILPRNDVDFNLLLQEISQLDKNVNSEKEQIPHDLLVKKAAYISDLISSGANPRIVAYEMQKTGLLGNFSISCPASLLQGSASFSEMIPVTLDMKDQFGSLSFSCPKCGRTNTRPYGKLISNCRHCGADVRC